jgi:Fic family protein
MYIYEWAGWPDFRWDSEALAKILADVRHRQGRLLGQVERLGFKFREEAELRSLTEEVVKSSEIEGEKLDRTSVRSSIARRLGIDVAGLKPRDRNVEGVVEMMLDATRGYSKPLTRERLFGWQASLFRATVDGARRMTVGAWRTRTSDPMQVVSGPAGHERIHFQAPAASRVASEMKAFLSWLNSDPNEQADIEPVLKAGVAHLWFVTIHPFDDGNGRTARAIADMCLARSEGSSQRFYSMSAQIRQERKAYYDRLEATQKGGLDVTIWLRWFLDCLGRAVDGSEALLANILAKARFWESVGGMPLNERQRLVLNRLWDGFEGKLTSSKWAKLTKSSQDTAHRDIVDLVRRGILVQSAEAGRSTSYKLAVYHCNQTYQIIKPVNHPVIT